MKKLRWVTSLTLFTFFLSSTGWAAPSYHLVGWFNTVVPGGGQALLGNYGSAALQASLETSTFTYGYLLSKRTPLTLDGVPQDLPIAKSGVANTSKTSQTCVRWNAARTRCLQFRNVTTSESTYIRDVNRLDESDAAFAMTLQEFGIKYHMVNVFNAYREAAFAQGERAIGEQKIDDTPTDKLFLAPFSARNLFNPWVGIPILLLGLATVYDYRTQIHSSDLQPLQPLTPGTNRLIAFNYGVWEPIGSGAPEEMFYRGFLQHEFYSWVKSPYFSIPMSTLAFSFSHAAPGRASAAIAGAYLGYLAHRNEGSLSPGIALHFWGVVFLGIETYLLTKRAQGLNAAPVTTSVSFPF